MDNRYNHHNRRTYNLKVHIVLVTKYRKQLLKGTIADDIKQKIFNICNSNDWNIITMEADKDQIHFLIGYDTTDRVCDIIKLIKQQTNVFKSPDQYLLILVGEVHFVVQIIFAIFIKLSWSITAKIIFLKVFLNFPFIALLKSSATSSTSLPKTPVPNAPSINVSSFISYAAASTDSMR